MPAISLRWAAVMIQAAGFSGMPRSDQEASEEARASCRASSARSNDPEMRIRLARIWPDSRRKTASTTARTSGIRRAGHLAFGTTGQARHHTDLDAAGATLAVRRDLGRPLDRFVQIRQFENVVASQRSLGLGDRPFG